VLVSAGLSDGNAEIDRSLLKRSEDRSVELTSELMADNQKNHSRCKEGGNPPSLHIFCKKSVKEIKELQELLQNQSKPV